MGNPAGKSFIRFTFHYDSIKTNYESDLLSTSANLHFTMILLKLQGRQLPASAAKYLHFTMILLKPDIEWAKCYRDT